jgi:WD40 repeat protein
MVSRFKALNSLNEQLVFESVGEDVLRVLDGPVDESRQFSWCSGRFDPTGRALFVSSTNSPGIRIFDIERGIEVARLPTEPALALELDAAATFLLVGNAHGITRWPLKIADVTYQFGAPQRVIHDPCTPSLGLTRDGRLAAYGLDRYGSEVRMFEPMNGQSVGSLHTSIEQSSHISLSCDGRWLAIGTWLGFGGEVWDVQSRSIVFRLPNWPSIGTVFSPDGRLLATNDDTGLAIWEVGTWQLLGRTQAQGNARIAFDPSSQIIAMVHDGYKVRLINAHTLHDLIILEPPDALPGRSYAFSPDGSRLVVFTHLSQIVYVWDLERLRSELSVLGLEWEAPASAPNSHANNLGPIRVEMPMSVSDSWPPGS